MSPLSLVTLLLAFPTLGTIRQFDGGLGARVTPGDGDLGWQGSHAVVVWTDARRDEAFGGPARPDVWLNRVAPDGGVLNPTGRVVCVSDRNEVHEQPRVATLGTKAWVLWKEVTSLGDRLRLAVIDQSGDVQPPCGVVAAGPITQGFWGHDLGVEPGTGTLAVAWRTPGCLNLRTFAGDAGALIAPVTLASAGTTITDSRLWLAGVDGGFVLAAEDVTLGTNAVLRVPVSNPTAVAPWVLYGAGRAALVERAPEPVLLSVQANTLFSYRVDPLLGTPLLGEPRSIGPSANLHPLAAVEGTGLRVVYDTGSGGVTNVSFDPPTGVVGTIPGGVPALPLALAPADPGQGSLALVRRGPDALALSPGPQLDEPAVWVDVNGGGRFQSTPSLIPNGLNFLLAWNERAFTRDAGTVQAPRTGLLWVTGMVQPSSSLAGLGPGDRLIRLVSTPDGGTQGALVERADGGRDVPPFLAGNGALSTGSRLLSSAPGATQAILGANVNVAWAEGSVSGGLSVTVGVTATSTLAHPGLVGGRGGGPQRGSLVFPVFDSVSSRLALLQYEDLPSPGVPLQEDLLAVATPPSSTPFAALRGDDALVTWSDGNQLLAVRRTVGAAPVGLLTLALNSAPLDPVAAPLPDGWFLAWSTRVGNSSELRGLVLYDDGGIDGPQVLSAPAAHEEARHPSLAVLPSGELALAWSAFSASAGGVSVRTRLLEYTPFDAGTAVDAGLADGGGSTDAGSASVDGGVSDAGSGSRVRVAAR